MNEQELQSGVNRLPKSIEPPRDLWPGIEARIARAGSWRRRWYWMPLAAAAVLLFLLIARAERSAWDVTALAGRPLIGTTRLAASGRLRVGDWLQTDDSSRALIAVGRIGQVEVRPDTRVQLVVAKANEHRLALARGTIDAKVDAVPRLFFVETPAGTAIDLGCAYTLETDSLGKGLLHVTGGQVEFQSGLRASRVPLGALAQIRPTGPGTPYVDDAPAPLVRALSRSISSVVVRARRATFSRWRARRMRCRSGTCCSASIRRCAAWCTTGSRGSCPRRPASRAVVRSRCSPAIWKATGRRSSASISEQWC
jgi:hypothetical protein